MIYTPKLRLAAIAASLFATSSLAAPAMAQNLPVAPISADHTLLSINAEGTSTREPDMAVFSAGVTTQGTTASAALAENSTRMNAVFAALKRAGIAQKDIQTSNLNVSPVYSQPARKPDGSYDADDRRIVGYQVSNNVSVRQRKLDDYGKVIDALVSAGANQVNGPDFTLSEPAAAETEARTAAVKAARERAELYAKAAGMRVVRIISISETGGYAPEIMMTARKMYDAPVAAAPAPPPLAAGEVQVTARLSVQFELGA